MIGSIIDALREAGVDSSQWMLTLVKLDPFHAMKRVTGHISKGHHAFKLFCCRFRDAMFVPFAADVDMVKAKIRSILAETCFSTTTCYIIQIVLCFVILRLMFHNIV